MIGLLGPTAEFGSIFEGDVWPSSSRSEPVREDNLKAEVFHAMCTVGVSYNSSRGNETTSCC